MNKISSNFISTVEIIRSVKKLSVTWSIISQLALSLFSYGIECMNLASLEKVLVSITYSMPLCSYMTRYSLSYYIDFDVSITPKYSQIS